jgi:hypothetical protein
VQARTVESIAISGAGSVQADRLKGASLATRISGSGDIRIGALDVDNLTLAISGNGDFLAAGRSDAVRIAISGSGDVKIANLAAKNVKLGISGAGDARVWATESLAVSISAWVTWATTVMLRSRSRSPAPDASRNSVPSHE